MKHVSTALLVGIGLLAVAMAWYGWDSQKNRGLTWGYWGQFNTVSNSLAKLSGITIVRSGCNADVTMEEFGFDVLTPERRQVHVWFNEGDPIRKLSGNSLAQALTDKIQKESSNNIAPPNAAPPHR